MTAMCNIYFIITLFIMTTALPAFAAKGFICNFSDGMVHTFENKVFQHTEAQPISIEIGDIDLHKQTASLLTDKGKGNLKIVRAIGANHYLEVITEGYLNITTIYNAQKSDALFPAVHSRHLGLLGIPVVSQYYGTCKLK